MTNHRRGQGVDAVELVDPPRDGEGQLAADHERRAGEAVNKCKLEPPNDSHNLGTKVYFFQLLGRRAPDHVDLEEVGQNSLRDVQRDPSQEDAEHWDPFDVFPVCKSKEMLVS